jgi:DNA-binding NtrC family response regulator
MRKYRRSFLSLRVAAAERQIIEEIIFASNGVVAEAARSLRMPRAEFYRRARAVGANVSAARERACQSAELV